MKNTVTTLALFFAMSQLVSGQAGSNNAVINNNIFLQGQYVEVGIAQCGVFGRGQRNVQSQDHPDVRTSLPLLFPDHRDGENSHLHQPQVLLRCRTCGIYLVRLRDLDGTLLGTRKIVKE